MKDDLKVLKWICHEARKSLWALAIITIIGILLAFVGVAFAIASKSVLDIATKTIEGNILYAGLVLGGLIVAQLALQALYTVIQSRARGRLEMRFRKNFFTYILEADYSSINNHHSGDLINRLFSDISTIVDGVMQIVPTGLSFAVRTLLSFLVLLKLDPVLAVLCILIGPIMGVISKIYRNKMKGLHKKTQEAKGKIMSFMQECLQSLLMIKSFNSEGTISGHSFELEQEHYRYSVKRNNISVISNILFYITVTAGYYFALAWEAYRLSMGLVTFGTLTAVMQLVGDVQVPFKGLSATIPMYFSMISSAERVLTVYNLPHENEAEVLDCKALYGKMDEIVVDNISFSYGDTPVFENASLRIKKGDTVAIASASGMGKSTFLKLLLGIIPPNKGSIHVCLKNGIKYNIDKSTRALFAYVPQGNMVLSGTIRDNIAFSDNMSYDEERIVSSAKAAQLWDFIEKLPKGLDTVIGEKGLGLSEGQVQRLAIARAIYHGSPVLLLDEATSALDEETEAALLRNITNLEGITCIIVSHRRAAFEICRQVIKIHDRHFNIFSRTDNF